MALDSIKNRSGTGAALVGFALCATLAVFGMTPAALAEEPAEGEAAAEAATESEAAATEETAVEIDYDLTSFDTILASMEADYEDTVAYLSEQYETVDATLGGTYAGYVANEQALDDWYSLVLSESQSLFDRLAAGSEEYLKLAASTASAEGDYYGSAYDAVSDLIDEVCYGIFDDYYDDVYGDLLDEPYDDYCSGAVADWDESIDVDEWEVVYNDCYETWMDARDDVYSLMNDGEEAIYRAASRADLAFSYDNYDVEAALNLSFLSDDLQSILEEIDADVDSTISSLSEELAAVSTPASLSYEDYAAVADSLTEWYALAQSETQALYDRIDDYTIEYYVALASIANPEDPYTMSAAFQEIYWAAYQDVYAAVYDGVYDELFYGIYNDVLFGTIYDWDVYGTDWYEQWAAEWEECYDEWDEACEAIYDLIWDQYDVFYDSYSEVRSAFLYDDNYDVSAILGVDLTAATETEDATVEEATAEGATEGEGEGEAATDDAAASSVSATLSVSVYQNAAWTAGAASGETAGATGENLAVGALAITMTADVSGSISYSVDLLGSGWTEWASDGATAGVEDGSDTISGIKVQLSDEAASSYDVWYRAWVDGYGWTGWAKNGAAAGTTSGDAIVEGVEVVILAAGSEAPGDLAPAVVTSSFEPDETEQAAEEATDDSGTSTEGSEASTEGVSDEVVAYVESLDAYWDAYIAYMDLAMSSTDADAITQAYNDFVAATEDFTAASMTVTADTEEDVLYVVEAVERNAEKLYEAGYTEDADAFLESFYASSGLSSDFSSDSSAEETESSTEAVEGVSEEFQAYVDSYEAFWDSYIVVMDLTASSDDEAAVMDAYLDFMAKTEEFYDAAEALGDAEPSDEEWAYYYEVCERIAEKLSSAGYEEEAGTVLEGLDEGSTADAAGSVAV